MFFSLSLSYFAYYEQGTVTHGELTYIYNSFAQETFTCQCETSLTWKTKSRLLNYLY